MRRFSTNSPFEGLEKKILKKKSLIGHDLLDTIDETPEFHDPYSELNLFLSQKIQREMQHCSNSKKWSPKLQEELLQKIAPEFQQRFPKYRLGTAALKKTWEKVQFYSSQIQQQKEALTSDGKLNISYFIKENLKSTGQLPNTCHVHPCHYAHQLAAKMSECIAVMDGIRPKLDQLTRTIWSLQRHLIPRLAPQHFKSPYDENEKIDKLIVRAILEITAKYPEISQAELSFYVQKQLIQLKHLLDGYTTNQMRKMLEALYADHCHAPTQRMEKTLDRIPYPLARCLKSELAFFSLENPQQDGQFIIDETYDYFVKTAQILIEVEADEIERKIQNWTIQSDMLIRWIRLNHNSGLYREILNCFDRSKSLIEIVEHSRKSYLDRYPHMLSCARELELYSWIYVKYIWYTKEFGEEISTYARFVKWHKELLKSQQLSPNELLEKIEKICKKRLPLIPFNRASTQTSLVTEEQDSA